MHVIYHLKANSVHRETAQKVHGFHADFCPVARTLRGCVEITTELRLQNG